MIKLNRKVEYALMALRFLSKREAGELSQVKEICDVTGSPFDATSRVMQQMANAGILKSEQGVHGGYYINKSLEQFSFYELSEVILGKLELAKCIKSPDSCNLIESCNIYSPIVALNKKTAQFFKSISLTECLG